MFTVTLRDEPSRRLAALAHRGPYATLGQAFDTLSAQMAAQGLLSEIRGVIGIGYDDPSSVPAANLRSAACFVVTETCQIDPPMIQVDLPAGPHAILRVTGPYTGLATAYQHLLRVWLPQSGARPADRPPFEVYLNPGRDTPAQDLVTEICLPLEPTAP